MEQPAPHAPQSSPAEAQAPASPLEATPRVQEPRPLPLLAPVAVEEPAPPPPHGARTGLEGLLHAPDDERARQLEEEAPLPPRELLPADVRSEQPTGPPSAGRDAGDDERAELLEGASPTEQLELDTPDPRAARPSGRHA